MAKKSSKMHADQPSAPPLSSTVKESAHQIWLAGLGAFSKAQEEGGKVFETLVKEGLSLQSQTQAAAQEKIAEASMRLNTMASGIQAQTENRLDKLETIFEDRVAKAITRLAIPSAVQMKALMARLDQLEKRVEQMAAPSAGAVPSATEPRRRATPTKTAAKKVATPPALQKAVRSPHQGTSPKDTQT